MKNLGVWIGAQKASFCAVIAISLIRTGTANKYANHCGTALFAAAHEVAPPSPLKAFDALPPGHNEDAEAVPPTARFGPPAISRISTSPMTAISPSTEVMSSLHRFLAAPPPADPNRRIISQGFTAAPARTCSRACRRRRCTPRRCDDACRPWSQLAARPCGWRTSRPR